MLSDLHARAIADLASRHVRGAASEAESGILADMLEELARDDHAVALARPDFEAEVRAGAIAVGELLKFRPTHMHATPVTRYGAEVREAYQGAPTPRYVFDGIVHARWSRRGQLLGRLRQHSQLAYLLTDVHPTVIGNPAWMPPIHRLAQGWLQSARYFAWCGRRPWTEHDSNNRRTLACPRHGDEARVRSASLLSGYGKQTWWFGVCESCRAYHWATSERTDIEGGYNPLGGPTDPGTPLSLTVNGERVQYRL